MNDKPYHFHQSKCLRYGEMRRAEIEVSIGVLVASSPPDLWLVAVVVALCVCLPVVHVNDRVCTAGVLLWV